MIQDLDEWLEEYFAELGGSDNAVFINDLIRDIYNEYNHHGIHFTFAEIMTALSKIENIEYSIENPGANFPIFTV